jgi:hypothetical protein
MAQVDIKNARIYFRDGYVGPGGTHRVNNSGGYSAAATTMKVDGINGVVEIGDRFLVDSDSTETVYTISAVSNVAPGTPLVNLMAGYMAGDSTIAVDGFTGIVYNGDTFTIASDGTNTVYTITGHSETLGSTTSLTFTPVLAESIADDDVINLIETLTHSITFAPGLAETVADNDTITILPHQMEITIGEGNFSWTEKHAREYKLNRGRLDKVRDGNQDPLEIKTEFTWEHYKSSTPGEPTPVDILDKTGEASGWVTSGSDPCEPYCVDLILVYTPLCDSEDIETLTFPEFRHEQRDFDLTKGTASLSGKCNVIKPTAVRTAQ